MRAGQQKHMSKVSREDLRAVEARIGIAPAVLDLKPRVPARLRAGTG
jgi:hypothetical protein